MTNEEIIDEMLYEAEELRIREYVLDMSLKLQELNPQMDRFDSIKLAMENAKLHSGIKSK
jgi:hypothetical protein